MYITHLLFPDDILFFCDGSHQDIQKIKEGLLLFQYGMGMVVNNDKYTITFSLLDAREIGWCSSLFPFKPLQIEDGLKYLGFYLKPNAYFIANWMWLLAKF